MTVVATAGHVDHGKSSLVLALTGTDPDRLIEERRRGLTIDLGFAAATLPSNRTIEIIDVPGHVRFLKNMLAGVGGVTGTIFVVAADDGWMPQSEEHLRVLELLGVTHGIVVLTKVDTVDEEMLELAHLDLEERLSDTFLAAAPIVECAAPAGRGVDEVRRALDGLLDRLPSTPDRSRARLWVDRSFAPAGVGTVVTGTLTDGTLHTDDVVEVGEDARTCRIRMIQTHGRDVEQIGPGHRVALNLANISHHDVSRGDAVVAPDHWHRTDTFDATLSVLPSLTHRVGRRGAYVAYLGSGEFPVRLRVLGDTSIDPGVEGRIRAHLSTRLPLVIGDRYILREVGRDETVGGGSILDVAPITRAAEAAPTGEAADLVTERGWLDVDSLYRFTGVHHSPTIGEWVVDHGVLTRLRTDLTSRAVDAGDEGLDLAPLSDLERAIAATLVEESTATNPALEIGDGVLRVAGSASGLQNHPLLERLRAEGLAPSPVEGDDVAAARAMERAGLVVHAEGMWFTTDAVDDAVARLGVLLEASPDGFTVAMARDTLGITRKHVLPLLGHLDGTGRTRRRGDLRTAGPRFDVRDSD